MLLNKIIQPKDKKKAKNYCDDKNLFGKKLITFINNST